VEIGIGKLRVILLPVSADAMETEEIVWMPYDLWRHISVVVGGAGFQA
jgi:hypothetical protein